MKILKSGTLKHHKFTCAHCGCEFVVDELEYITEYGCTSDCRIKQGFRPEYTLIIKAKCPTCKKLIEDWKTEYRKDKLKDFEDNWKEPEEEEIE